ncbi:hypothetical protein V5O49_00065, partial [Isoptericola sp. MSP01]
GASAVVEPGERVPARADPAVASVGQAPRAHSVRSVRPGGTIVLPAAPSGAAPPAPPTPLFLASLPPPGVPTASPPPPLSLWA